jgi:hypothetical protein
MDDAGSIGYKFDVYSYRFCIRGAPAEAVNGIREDFAFFSSPGVSAEFVLELVYGDPPFHVVPPVDAAVYTPRNVVYRSDGRRFIDYHGRALGIQEESTGCLKLYSSNADLLYEAAYLYLLSQIGQYLDRRALHRVHALGISVAGRVVLALLPMGGGKSTLALHLMKFPEVRILSDDSPLVDRKGYTWAYPLRIGLLPGSEDSIPPEHRRIINRMEFGPKHLVNYSFFAARVCPSAAPGLMLIGRRRATRDCVIQQVGIVAGLRACIANCVIGVGLFQGLEFVLRSSPWELLKHGKIGLSRLLNCIQLLRRSRVCVVHLGSDPELNARTVLNYASGVFGIEPGNHVADLTCERPK